MATETIRPNANGDSSQCIGSDANSTNNYQLIDESSANDADYVYALVGNLCLDLYNIPSTAIPVGATINKITFYARFREDTSGVDVCEFAYKSDGTVYYSPKPNVTTSWAEYSWEQTTNQKTSAAWTIDDINALQIGVRVYSEYKVSNGTCSQLWIVIDYTEAALNQTIIIF